MARFKHPSVLGQKLCDDMHAWWRAAGIEAEWVFGADKQSTEFVINMPKPPVEEWQLRAKDVIHNLRESLDALARNAAHEFVGGLGATSPFPPRSPKSSRTAGRSRGRRRSQEKSSIGSGPARVSNLRLSPWR